MLELIQANGGLAITVSLILVCLNILLTAVKLVCEKIEAATPEVEGPQTVVVQVRVWAGKIAGWIAPLIDWLTGNKAH